MSWNSESTLELRKAAVMRIRKTWAEFWEELILGAVEPEREYAGTGVSLTAGQWLEVQANLSDWLYAMGEVAEVYSHITGGMLSKPNYAAAGVISAADEHYERIANDGVLDMLLDLGDVGLGIDQQVAVVEYILERFDLTADDLTDAAKQSERIKAIVAKANND